jgi:hypothetical protein
MPKAAAAIGAAVEIRPLGRIAGRLLDFSEMTNVRTRRQAGSDR